ncbi:MAG: DUF6242 domain-containing protein [Muribaculum sp.]|nr:DUF6242 domain-containing protein [Muribaculaceae bacterium]MCM1080206.1 DUF6242 domain-containing protein [Muribaculum sp.]
MIKHFAKLVLATLAAGITLCACNEDSKEYSLDGIDLTIDNNSNTAITSFSLKANSKVITGLDSVYFSIDLENYVIFNADSLPKGTNVGKLLVNIGNSGSSKIVINYTDYDSQEAKEVEYSETSRDSINFFDDVTVTVTSLNERQSKSYTVKVNVHQMEPDSLCWGSVAYAPLPANGTPWSQGTVMFRGKLYCFTADVAGNITLASTATPEVTTSWQKQNITLPFSPVLESVKATDNLTAMLSTDGSLYLTEDMQSWESAHQHAPWVSILGGINGTVYGVAKDNGKYVYSCYPSGQNSISIEGTEVPSDFPISGTSAMYLFTNQWSEQPQGIITGGRCANGTLCNGSWGFDGTSWAKFGTFPDDMALENITVFPYYTFRVKTANWEVIKYPTLIAFGGNSADGTVERKVYISRDNGLNWRLGGDLLQLPEEMPSLSGAQAFVVEETLHSRAASSGNWTEISLTRIPTWFEIEGSTASSRAVAPITQWDCPYIYLFGGRQQDGQLSNSIWRGLINRLSFKPLQ